MLLRTSSAPVLYCSRNSCLLLADSCKDSSDSPNHVHSSRVSFHHNLGSPSAVPGRASRDGHGICAMDNSGEGELVRSLPFSLLSRAQSEGDLACFSAAMAGTTPEKHGLSGHEIVAANDFTRVPRVQSHQAVILEEIDVPDQLSSASCSPPQLHTLPMNTSHDTIPDLKFGPELVLSDGERYSSLKMSSSGSPLACNVKGCRPLTQSECKELGFLDMASGVGSGRFVPREHAEGQAFDVSDSGEAYFQSLLQKDPGNPLLLRNYAQFLFKKGDAKKAEEFYERAILADPSDGEVISQYAKLQWDVNRDQDRAETYFDRAVKAAPADCYVMASYASFLWDVEDDADASTANQASRAYNASSIVSSKTVLAPA